MELNLVANEEKYYNFIRLLRTHPENQVGFLEKVEITQEQQNDYMSKYGKYYYVCLENEMPLGYVGVVDNDIRICTDPKFKKKGIGFFMLNEVMKIHPNATAKILKNNLSSLNLFTKCGFSIVNTNEILYFLRKNEI